MHCSHLLLHKFIIVNSTIPCNVFLTYIVVPLLNKHISFPSTVQVFTQQDMIVASITQPTHDRYGPLIQLFNKFLDEQKITPKAITQSLICQYLVWAFNRNYIAGGTMTVHVSAIGSYMAQHKIKLDPKK